MMYVLKLRKKWDIFYLCHKAWKRFKYESFKNLKFYNYI